MHKNSWKFAVMSVLMLFLSIHFINNSDALETLSHWTHFEGPHVSRHNERDSESVELEKIPYSSMFGVAGYVYEKFQDNSANDSSNEPASKDTGGHE